jgi:DNA-binding MarR family transcriptional regulator
MPRRGLTEKQKLALYGIVRHPQLNQRQTAERIGMKHSTFATIKKKLQGEGYFDYVTVPKLRGIGYELLRVNYLWLRTPTDGGKALRAWWQKKRHHYLSVFDYDHALLFSIDHNVTETRESLASFAEAYYKDWAHPRGITEALFPFDTTTFAPYFDFGPLLERTFDLKKKAAGKEETFFPPREEGVRLKETEKKVWYLLVKYPEITDVALGRKIESTRNTVRRIREKLEREKLVQRIAVVNLKRIGYEILVLLHLRLKPLAAAERQKLLREIRASAPVLFLANHDLEAVFLLAYRTFSELQTGQEAVLGQYRKRDLLAAEPSAVYFSVPTMEVLVNHDYTRLLRRALGIPDVR